MIALLSMISVVDFGRYLHTFYSVMVSLWGPTITLVTLCYLPPYRRYTERLLCRLCMMEKGSGQRESREREERNFNRVSVTSSMIQMH